MAAEKNSRSRLSLIFTLLFVAAFLVYFAYNPGLLEPLSNIPAVLLLFIIIAKLALIAVNGLFMKWTVELFTGAFRFLEGFYIATLSAIGNFFGPLLGGASIRAVYLKKVHNLSYSKFTATLAGYYVILFILNSLIAIICLLFLPDSALTSTLLLFFGIWLLILSSVVFLRLPQREKLRKIDTNKVSKFFFTVLYDVEAGWDTIKSQKKLVIKLCFTAVLIFIIAVAMASLEFRAINTSISIYALGFYAAVSTASMLISITPGAIGIRESLLILTSTVMGVTNEQILQVAVIDRTLTFVCLALLYLVTKFIKPSRLNKQGIRL